MKSQLFTAEVGTIYLMVSRPGAKAWTYYVCSSVSINMTLNNIPMASAVIGCGASIRYGHVNTSDNNAEDILEYVMDAAHNTSEGFLDCQLVEVFMHEKKIIENILFKGCIVTASLVYKTGATTVRAVRVDCMNAACKLYAQPLSAYNHTVGSYIIDALTHKEGKRKQVDQNTAIGNFGMSRVGRLTDTALITSVGDLVKHKDIATKIAYLADAIAIVSTKAVDSVDLKKTVDGKLLKILDYIKSDYYINYELLDVNDIADSKFDSSLCNILIDGMRTSNIYNSIAQAVMSQEFMLNLVPGWQKDDFKLSLQPSRAWESKPSVTLTFEDISELNSSYNPLNHINDPEVFAVNFSPAVNFEGTQGQVGVPSAMVGAYSRNPEIQKWILERFNDGESELRKKLVDNLTNFKWTIYPSPTWLRLSFVRTKEQTANGKQEDTQKKSVAEERTQAKELSPDVQQLKAAAEAKISDMRRAAEISNEIAKALYVHLHGESATAQVTLLPDMRFGMVGSDYSEPFALEDHIGEVIDIVPTEDDDNHLAIRGIIQGLAFTYSAGQSASCSYTMILSRVRPLTQDAEDITCPLYVRGESIPQSAIDNDALKNLESILIAKDTQAKLDAYNKVIDGE